VGYKFIRVPVVTLTGWPEETVPRKPPSPIYLSTIWSGLQETYPDMSDSEIQEYLQNAQRSEHEHL
jgi:hypothetical protein